jgi:aminoglycoside phosphotransferase (APT) family kinase protein
VGLTEWERDGDTVWRPAMAANAGIDRLLRHLATVGFTGAPLSHGLDDDGRLGVTWIVGDAGASVGVDDAALASTADLIRRYHDAVAGFEAPAELEPMVGAPPAGPLVCHNDHAPGNTIYRQGTAVALIDFDLAGPGDAVWDLAYAAWRHVPLYEPDFFAARGAPVPDQARRLSLLLDSYGLTDRGGFVDVICARMQSLYDTARVWGGEQRREGWADVWDATAGRQWLASLRHAEANQRRWASAIGS